MPHRIKQAVQQKFHQDANQLQQHIGMGQDVHSRLRRFGLIGLIVSASVWSVTEAALELIQHYDRQDPSFPLKAGITLAIAPTLGLTLMTYVTIMECMGYCKDPQGHHRPHDPDEKPKRHRYDRHFGVPISYKSTSK